MPSLSQVEARARAELITVRSTDIILDLSDQQGAGAEEFSSITTIEFDASPGAETFLDFKGVRLNSVTLNGHLLDLASWSDDRIPLTGLASTNTVRVDGVMAYSSDGEGLHRHVDPADGKVYLYAMSFLDAGPRWFACFDQPDLKSQYRLEVLAPADWTVHGNGPAIKGAVSGPSTGSGPSARWTITPPHPLSSYFVTLIAGPYASVYSEHDGIPYGIHVRASLGEALEREAEDIFTVTGQCFDYYHRIFGVRYPFGEYHQAFVPDFNAGAMENPGGVTFRDSFIYRARATRSERASRAGVIAHEMAHQWFGDLVTMRWWDDLWLNESFAEYMAHRCCTEATDYPLMAEFGIMRKAWGYVVDQSDATHPVAGNGAADAATALQNFDGISYAKGAAVLLQLASYLGDDVFLAGLRRHFDDHRFGNAEFAELVANWTAAGGVDLERWTEQWLLTAGLDTLQVHTLDDGGRALLRTPPRRHPADRLHAVEVAGVAEDGELIDAHRVVVGDVAQPVATPQSAVAMVPDALDETWAKIRFEPDDWATLATRVSKINSSGTRVTVWNSLRDQVQDAELDPQRALQMIIDQLGTETEDVIVAGLLTFARISLAGPYAPIDQRASRLALAHGLAQQMLTAAEVGSDRQLIAFRAAIASSADQDQLDSWRQERGLPAGIEIDPELRWSMVTRLCSLVDRPGIIAETLRIDTSAAAAVNAARARAALPSPQAKEAAYRLITEPSQVSAYELYATAEAMFGYSAEQVELTRSYALRFFDDIAGTAAFRSGWVLGKVPTLAFPESVTEPEILARAERLAAAADVPLVIARVMAEETDPLRRALASVSRFGSAVEA